MKNSSRYPLLLFCALLTLFTTLSIHSTVGSVVSPLFKTGQAKAEQQPSYENFNFKTEQCLFSLPIHHGKKELASQGHSLSIVTGKNLVKDNTISGILVAKTITENTVYRYISLSKYIQVSLSIQDLIFPFHYFF